jgi:hypothetical protein
LAVWSLRVCPGRSAAHGAFRPGHASCMSWI